MRTGSTFEPIFWRFATPFNLERAGFVRCDEQGCNVFLDPVNVPELRCHGHQRRTRTPRAAQGDQARRAA